jgi:hypothetical protein
MGHTNRRRSRSHDLACEPILSGTPGAESVLEVLSRVGRSTAEAYLTGVAAGSARSAGVVSTKDVECLGHHHEPVPPTSPKSWAHQQLLMTYSAKPPSTAADGLVPPS